MPWFSLFASQVDEKKWGSEKCRCIGYNGAPGQTNVSINGAEVPYPAEAGASCEAWDAKNHPDCLGGWVKMLGKITLFKSYKWSTNIFLAPGFGRLVDVSMMKIKVQFSFFLGEGGDL